MTFSGCITLQVTSAELCVDECRTGVGQIQASGEHGTQVLQLAALCEQMLDAYQQLS